MNNSTKRKMMSIIISLAVLYVAMLFLLTLFQRKIIYYPYKLDTRFEFPEYVSHMEEVFITCDDGCTIHGLFVPGSKGKPTIVIFHGNAGNVTHRDFRLQEFHRLGYSVLLMDYHGYGKSEGTPTEKNLYLDGDASVRWLKENKKVTPAQMVIFTESLGGGVAVELATRYQFKGVIMETPLSSLAAVTRYHFPYKCFPAKLMLMDTFDNLSKIQHITCPILFIHGTHDTIVDKRESEKLFAKATAPKELYLVEGADHNDIPFIEPQKYWGKISEWLSRIE